MSLFFPVSYYVNDRACFKLIIPYNQVSVFCWADYSIIILYYARFLIHFTGFWKFWGAAASSSPNEAPLLYYFFLMTLNDIRKVDIVRSNIFLKGKRAKTKYYKKEEQTYSFWN
jgi:hypothetical protein